MSRQLTKKGLRPLEKLALILLLCMFGLSAGLYVGGLGESAPATGTQTEANDNGFGSYFTLQSPNGPISLHDFKNQVVILQFGYSSCPDVCPTGLANVAAALDQLDDAELKQVQPLFVSVDPERDTLERLAQYAPHFHPKMIGLTGGIDELSRIALSFGAFFRKVEMKNSALGYSVDHTARLYLLDGNGQMRALMEHNTPPPVIAAAARELLKELSAG